MHIGMKVRHPELGAGTVKGISEHVADIRFDSGLRSLAPEQSDLDPGRGAGRDQRSGRASHHPGRRDRQRPGPGDGPGARRLPGRTTRRSAGPRA